MVAPDPDWLKDAIAATQEEMKVPLGEWLQGKRKMPESLNPLPAGPTTERLLRFEAACESLYPAIRYMGLCGCHPQYLAAIIEIGDLLGKHSANAPQVDPAAIIAGAERNAISEIAGFVATSPEVRDRVGRKLAAEFAELIKKLQISHD